MCRLPLHLALGGSTMLLGDFSAFAALSSLLCSSFFELAFATTGLDEELDIGCYGALSVGVSVSFNMEPITTSAVFLFPLSQDPCAMLSSKLLR